jgi:hypothetical protein
MGSPSYHGISGLDDGLSVMPGGYRGSRRVRGRTTKIPGLDRLSFIPPQRGSRRSTGSRSHHEGPQSCKSHRRQVVVGAPLGPPFPASPAGRGVIDRRRLVVVGPPEPAFPRTRRVVLSGLPSTSRARLVAGTGICHAFLAPLGPPSRSSQAPGHRGRTSRLPSSSPPAFLSSQPPGRRRHLSRLPAGHHRRQVVVGSTRAFLTAIAGAWSSPVSLARIPSGRRRHLSRLPSVAPGRRRHLSRRPGTSQLVIAGARSSWAPLACLRRRRHLLPAFRSSYLSRPPFRSSQAPSRRGHHSPSCPVIAGARSS